MRIKTSKKTLDNLAQTTKVLNFSSNAETLKLAIAFALNKYSNEYLIEHKVSQNGFEIDTHILFGDELDYYNEIIKFVFKTNEIKAEHYCLLIEEGFIELSKILKENKNDITKLVNHILEE